MRWLQNNKSYITIFIHHKIINPIMKKSLLIIATLISAVSVFADEWQQPKYSGSFQPLTPGDTVYIYNTEAGMFLTEGNDWGTHASVGTTGLKCVVNKHIEDEAEWDGKTYTIADSSVVKSAWKNLFINAEGLYVDRSSQADYFFSFVDLGNNKYNIYGADINPVYNAVGEMAGYVVGHFTRYINTRDGEATGTGVIYDYNGEDNDFQPGKFNDTWAFVSQADYAAYLAQTEIYQTAMKLKTLLEQATTFGVDVAAEKAVYDNTSSTKQQLQDAYTSLNAKVLKYYETSVTPDSPINLTDMITDPTCDATNGWENAILASTWENANMSAGWQTGWEEEAFIDNYLNIWGASLQGLVGQSLSGLPNGIYVFSISALAEKEGASVYCNENTKTIPADSKGRKFSITANVTNGNVNFGIRQDVAGENWLCIDNASLKYYGAGLDAYKHWLSELKETAPDLSKELVQGKLVEEYNAILNRVADADTEEKILAVVKDYEDIIDRLSFNALAYNNLNDAINNGNTLAASTELNEYYGNQINDFIQLKAEPAIEELALSTEEVNALIKELEGISSEAQEYIWNMEKLEAEASKAAQTYEDNKATCPASAADAYVKFADDYKSLDKSQLKSSDVLAMLNELYDIEFNLNLKDEPASDDNPIDYTAKIYNPSFDGVDGWTNDGWATFGNNTWYGFANEEGASSGDGNYLNLWNKSNARGYQQISGLPAGAYTVQCGAFADKEGLQLYANDNIIDVEVGQNGNNEYMRIYRIDAIVGEDGILEFGIKNTNGGEIWAMVDEVHLMYKGTESEIMTCIKKVENTSVNEGIYTLTGVKVNNMLKGIYIKNGKKVVIK